MFGKMFNSVSYFVIFCNLVNILDVGPAATKSNIKIQVFFRMGNTTAKTVLNKLMSPTLLHLIKGKWERCNALSGNQDSKRMHNALHIAWTRIIHGCQIVCQSNLRASTARATKQNAPSGARWLQPFKLPL
jgi:hypothetical protein